MPARRRPKPVLAAVRREIALIRGRDEQLAKGALAASAKALAEELDDPENSAHSKSMIARELRETMDRLRELVPEELEEDALDELRNRRDARRSGDPAA